MLAAAAREAGETARNAIANAEAGKENEALNDALAITKAVFAALPKKHQTEIDELKRERDEWRKRYLDATVEGFRFELDMRALGSELVGKNQELKAKEEELKAKETEVKAGKEETKRLQRQLKIEQEKPKAWESLDVIITQAGRRPSVWVCTVYEEETLQDTLKCYVEQTGQDVKFLVVFDLIDGKLAQPEKMTLEPRRYIHR